MSARIRRCSPSTSKPGLRGRQSSGTGNRQAHPSTCGEYAYRAIAPTQRLFAAARKAGIPVVYTNGAPESTGKLRGPNRAWAYSETNLDPYGIREEFKPMEGDRMIYKERASGCVRATVVDGCSHSYHMTVVEDCCFDRILVTHKINLFDLHHKYADVMHVDAVVADLEKRAASKTSR